MIRVDLAAERAEKGAGIRAIMSKQRIVALYGDSLLMDTVEASLEGHPEVGVIRIHTTVADAAKRMKSLCPDLVILDLNDANAQLVMPFLKDLPGVPLLCLDASCSKVISLSSRQYTALTSNDLAHLINMQTASGENGIEPSPLMLNTIAEEILQ